MNKVAFAVLGLLACTGGAASAATSVHTSESDFAAATGGAAITTQSFETDSGSASKSSVLDFGDVAVSCVGATYCTSFFGRTEGRATSGSYSVRFATPDSATFSFHTAITGFGLDVIGLGTVGATNFFADTGDGPVQLLSNYVGTHGGVAFVGLTSTTAFNSVTFSGSAWNDGIYFDRLKFASVTATSAVPEPSTWAMMIGGFGIVGGALRSARRKQKGAALDAKAPSLT